MFTKIGGRLGHSQLIWILRFPHFYIYKTVFPCVTCMFFHNCGLYSEFPSQVTFEIRRLGVNIICCWQENWFHYQISEASLKEYFICRCNLIELWRFADVCKKIVFCLMNNYLIWVSFQQCCLFFLKTNHCGGCPKLASNLRYCSFP